MKESTGTFECPICGFDKPHEHDGQTIEWHRTGHRVVDGVDWGPLNDAQRRGLFHEAKAQHRHAVIRESFKSDPVATIRSCGAVVGYQALDISQRDWLFQLQELIVGALTERTALLQAARERQELVAFLREHGRTIVEALEVAAEDPEVDYVEENASASIDAARESLEALLERFCK